MPTHFYLNTHCTHQNFPKNGIAHIKITGHDVFSGEEYSVVVKKEELDSLYRGAQFQEAFKSISKEDREFLISGIAPESFALIPEEEEQESLQKSGDACHSTDEDLSWVKKTHDKKDTYQESEARTCDLPVEELSIREKSNLTHTTSSENCRTIYRKGQGIKHLNFGNGIILSISDCSDNPNIGINFEACGYRQIELKYLHKLLLNNYDYSAESSLLEETTNS